MLYKIGTKKELPKMLNKLPWRVYTELLRGVVVLDSEYGEDRNYLLTGGYSLIVETADDLPRLKATVDYEAHLCEWATKIGRDTGYISALYIINDDFSIMVYMPRSFSPNIILDQLED